MHAYNHIIFWDLLGINSVCAFREIPVMRGKGSAKINLFLSPKNNAGYEKNPSQHPGFKNERVRVPPPDLQQLPNKQEHQ